MLCEISHESSFDRDYSSKIIFTFLIIYWIYYFTISAIAGKYGPCLHKLAFHLQKPVKLQFRHWKKEIG